MRITDDGYKGGREEHCTQRPRMDVNLLATYLANMDNHPSLERRPQVGSSKKN